ncbi:MAG: glycosyltransferase family A protein, partial [Lachnospiraceae bacterium]|nr:glycosyltransferase family A protein [Lachnospiraceae bacterium]
MPVFNTHADILKESVNSILNQTFTEFEFIIIDDFSTLSET